VFLIGTAALQPFLLKTLHILPDIGINRPNALQHLFSQYIFPDIVSRAGASTAFVVGAYIVVLLVPLDGIPVLSGALALGELEVVRHQSLQSRKSL
jgi:hypothetical protein